MSVALLGATGFVGSNLRDARDFDAVFSSRDIGDLAGRRFDVVYSAATRADSYRINENPDADLAEIDGLIDIMARARIGHLVLVSTVCVYPAGTSPDESDPLSDVGLTPYGRNRLHMERRLGELFETTVLRLPQLYGAHLRKGVVHDLLHNHRVDHIRSDAKLQHYDVRRLADDAARALQAGLPAVNLATPAITNARLAEEVFGRLLPDRPSDEPESTFARMYSRDMRTRHAELFGGCDGYLCDRDSVITDLREFVAVARDAGSPHA